MVLLAERYFLYQVSVRHLFAVCSKHAAADGRQIEIVINFGSGITVASEDATVIACLHTQNRPGYPCIKTAM
ncbi:MAG: hypothetical protein RSE05_04990 [Clostridium sp.]